MINFISNKQNELAQMEPYSPEDRIWVTTFDDAGVKNFSTSVLKVANKSKLEPVVLYIDSYGGYVDCLFSMISLLDSIPNPVITVAVGKAMSCGAVLLSHGDIRCASEHARIMVHETSGGASGNIQDTRNTIKEGHRLNVYLMKLLAQNCDMPFKKMKSLFSNEKRDLYLTARQAKSMGLVDKIGLPKVTKHTKFELKIGV